MMADNKDSFPEEDQTATSAKHLCKILSELNDISLCQIEGLLGIAIKAAEVANSLDSANHSSGETGKLEELAGYLKTKAEDFNQKADNQNNKVSQVEKTTQTPAFSDIDRNIIIAMENSLSNQQQLNITGIAILSQAAELLFAAAGKKTDKNNKTKSSI